MTYQEAINIINTSIAPINDVHPDNYDKVYDAISISVEALKKQIDKEPLNIYDVPFDVHLFGDCPSCGCRVNTMMYHCDGCGQKLDWKVWKNYWGN